MLTVKPHVEGPLSLSLLIRQAYRSLHFYDSNVVSCVLWALAELSFPPPRHPRSLLLSILTILPNFNFNSQNSSQSLALLFHSLTRLQLHHGMLTAHLLKQFLRCSFNTNINISTTTTNNNNNYNEVKEINNNSGSHVGRQQEVLTFITSLAIVLRTLEYLYCNHQNYNNDYNYKKPGLFITALFDSIEEMLEDGYSLSSFSFYSNNNYYHYNNSDENIYKIYRDMKEEDIAEDIYIVIRHFFNTSHYYGGKSKLKFLDSFLAPLTNYIRSNHIISLLNIIEEKNTILQKWYVPIDKKKDFLTKCHLQLLHNFASRFKPINLLPALFSNDEVLILLQHINHYKLNFLSKDIQNNLYNLVEDMCNILEKSLLKPEILCKLAINDLLELKEDYIGLKLNDDNNSTKNKYLTKPRLKVILDCIFQTVQENNNNNNKTYGFNEWEFTEAIISLNIHVFFHLFHNSKISTEIVLQSCDLTCIYLNKILKSKDLIDSTLELRIFRKSTSLKLILEKVELLFKNNNCTKSLTEVLVEYENKILMNFSSKKINTPDIDLHFLLCILNERKPSKDLLIKVDKILELICQKTNTSYYTCELLVKLITIFKNNEWMNSFDNNKRWLILITSIRFSNAFKYIFSNLNTSEEWSKVSYYAFEILLDIFVIICPLQDSNINIISKNKNTCVMACIPEYEKVIVIINNLLKNYMTEIVKFSFEIEKSNENIMYSSLYYSNISERFALESRSLKLPQENNNNNYYYCKDRNFMKNENDIFLLYISNRDKSLLSMMIDFALWLSAFLYGIKLKNLNLFNIIQLSLLDMNMLKELQFKILESIIKLIFLSEYSETELKLKQKILRTYQIISFEENLKIQNNENSILIQNKEFIRLVPWIISELFRFINESYDVDKNSINKLKNDKYINNEYSQLFKLNKFNNFTMNAIELAEFLLQFIENFKLYDGEKRSLHILQNIIWESLSCISTMNNNIHKWIEKFRHNQSFHVNDLWNNEFQLWFHEKEINNNNNNNNDIILTNQRNTLLWSLFLLLCFMRHCFSCHINLLFFHKTNTNSINISLKAIGKLILLISYYTPVLKRSRPAPESLFALNICEVIEEKLTAGISLTEIKQKEEEKEIISFLIFVLAEVLKREEGQLIFWQTKFPSVAMRMKRYL